MPEGGGTGNDPLIGMVLALLPILIGLGVILAVVAGILDGWRRLSDGLNKPKEIRTKNRSVNRMGAGRTVVLAVVAIAMFAGYGVAVFGWLNVNYAYQHAIGAYLTNAYDAPNFEVMKANLINGYGGMLNKSLQPSDCGKAWGFEQTQA